MENCSVRTGDERAWNDPAKTTPIHVFSLSVISHRGPGVGTDQTFREPPWYRTTLQCNFAR